jgi:hypothetical protein
VTRVTIHFEDHNVSCDRMQLRPQDFQEGDFLVCPFMGFIHIHSIVVRDPLVDLVDCDERAHIYNMKGLLEVARPVDGSPTE